MSLKDKKTKEVELGVEPRSQESPDISESYVLPLHHSTDRYILGISHIPRLRFTTALDADDYLRMLQPYLFINVIRCVLVIYDVLYKACGAMG